MGVRPFRRWWPMLSFKQKTAYGMRISDWSSDVCSSDLGDFSGARLPFSPKWQSSLSADYSLPLGGVNLTMGTTISSQSKSLGVLAITNADKDLYEVNGRTLVSARLGVEAPDGRWAV